MPHSTVSRRKILAGALGTSALLALPRPAAPAVKKGTALRMWILKTYVEPTNKAIEASAARWAATHGASPSARTMPRIFIGGVYRRKLRRAPASAACPPPG